MEQSVFTIRISNRTFEPYAGIGYVDAGGCPERLIPLKHEKMFLNLYLAVDGYIRDGLGNIIGCRIRNTEENRQYEVYPGEVKHIDVWITSVDDDGCPEEDCIEYCLELLPNEVIPQVQ